MTSDFALHADRKEPTTNRTWVSGEGLEPGDAYQEGPYVVFTAQYHLRRGYCCNSGCRHCPYRGPVSEDE